MFTEEEGKGMITDTVALPHNGQASATHTANEAVFAQLVQQNSVLMAQIAQMQNMLAIQHIQPLKAALERKRLKVMANCPPIGKDLLVQFKTGGEYSTTDTNVVKNTLKPLLDQYGITYQCAPLTHTVTNQPNGSYLYKVALRFNLIDVETGYCETAPGEWYGIWIGSLDKGYASAITNGIGKFLVSYFSISSFDRPDEYATDEQGNPVVIREQKGTGRRQQQPIRHVAAPAEEQATSKSELDYGRAKAVFGVIKHAEEVKQKYEELLKLKDKPYDKASVKRAFIERYYQLVDLDLSDENQQKFIVENWKGTLYTPNGKQQHYRIYVMDAEIVIRSEETAQNLQKLEQFKKSK